MCASIGMEFHHGHGLPYSTHRLLPDGGARITGMAVRTARQGTVCLALSAPVRQPLRTANEAGRLAVTQ